jgi:hypothetical protein
MGQITRDGVTFDSDWIDASVARFKNKQILWAVRMHQYRAEVRMREADLGVMVETTPDDLPGLAHSRAHIDALKAIEEELSKESLNPHVPQKPAKPIPG